MRLNLAVVSAGARAEAAGADAAVAVGAGMAALVRDCFDCSSRMRSAQYGSFCVL